MTKLGKSVTATLLDDGWAWVAQDTHLIDPQGYGREMPLPGGFSRMQKARLGCIISKQADGITFAVDYGRSKPQDPTAPDDAEQMTAEECLSASLSAAVADLMADSPRTAVAALVAALASGGHVLDVRAGNGARGSAETFAQVFDHVRHATDAGLIQILGNAVREIVAVTPEEADGPTLRAVLDHFGHNATEKAIAYAFDRRAYFNALELDEIGAAVLDATLIDDRAAAVLDMAKDDAVRYAVAETAKVGWLPKPLRLITGAED